MIARSSPLSLKLRLSLPYLRVRRRWLRRRSHFLRYTDGERLTTEAIRLRFEVQSSGEPAEVRLTQNGRQQPIEGAIRSTSSSGDLKVFQYDLADPLLEGSNKFEVFVVTGEGVPSSRGLTLIRKPETGKLWVVAIGISDYGDPAIPDLQFAEADPRAVHDYFRDSLKLPADQLFLLTGERATLKAIKNILGTRLAAEATSTNDTVILYFAGHGARDRVAGSPAADSLSKYLLPYDATLTDLYSKALEMDEIAKILRRLLPGRIVVILDSCLSARPSRESSSSV